MRDLDVPRDDLAGAADLAAIRSDWPASEREQDLSEAGRDLR